FILTCLLCFCHSYFFLLLFSPPPISTLFPYTTLFRSDAATVLLIDLLALGADQKKFDVVMEIAKVSLVLVKVAGMLDVFEPMARSEEHTSELQSLRHLVCRLLLEKKKNKINKLKS